MLDTLVEMVKIKSISGNLPEIEKIIKYVHKYFEGKKVFIKRFDFPNASPALLISNRNTDKLDIMAVGHLDVVPAEDKLFEPKIKGDKIFGRGTVDMKGAVVATFNTLDWIVKNNKDIAFGILLSTDEETTSEGAKGFAKYEKTKAKIVLDIDAGDLHNIIEKYKHSVGVKIRANGIASHSSRPWDGINAINHLMSVLETLQKKFCLFEKDVKQPKSTWCNTMNITAISSPKTVNVTPAWAEAIVNFRLTDKLPLAELEKMLKELCKADACEYEVFMKSSGCYMDKKNPYIVQYKKVAEKILGEKINITHMCGATDSRNFAKDSVIIMQGCNGEDMHGDNEYLEISSMKKLHEIQKAFVEELVKSGK